MTRPKAVSAPSRLRCAIYTRKSSEEGLDQDFNSLHAQREACEAYVRSQAGEGWGALAGQYDDGGFSGGNMARPGLEKLMADVDARRVDVVVVYKVDRLTRSLADFAKIVERFDAAGVSFVSVTQSFNTTTSMGRLTLNVLLSFAQFEREVTGERIRDKIAASKAKGMWMGGNVPLGYDAQGRALVVNEVEAEQVRQIYLRYLELGSVHMLRDELEAQGRRSKRRTTLSGKEIGGAVLGRGALFHMLSNRHYIGEIVHKDTSYPGAHPPIVEREVFDAVQLKLAENAGAARRRSVGLEERAPAAPLGGLVFDDRGNPMASVSARKGKGQLYRYYVSTALQQGRRSDAGSLARFPGLALEELLIDRLRRLGLAVDGATSLRSFIGRVEVSAGTIVAHLTTRPQDHLAYEALGPGDDLSSDDGSPVLTIRAHLSWRGGAKRAIGPQGAAPFVAPKVDLTLLKALVRAEACRARMLDGSCKTLDELAAAEGVTQQYARALTRLAFLSPSLKRAILDGTASGDMNLQMFMTGGVPLAWADQDTLVSHRRSRSG
ncbi:MAG TPA: recombinase family protein [Caulobacteraceae bacterium]|jgi:DNA invertase Pin-like site-specific DNA recombinase|nr:recombinase family protein [Caulobacteraceae bacterium]